MDELDREILNILRRDARTPYTEIAERVGTSEGTVRNRVEGMVEEGVIERFTVTTRTGNVKAMIEISVAMDVNTDEVGKRLAEWDEVDFVWQVSGEDDIVLIVDCVDTRAVNELITRAREQEEVEESTTRLILDERLGS
ncbi:Lrp/AsnC family transcriptional regulator [Halolamina sp. CBA1230]|uniref:Lrp/AsnC family transcriptional regulator n=1 Tax=Halolamina sp. CBA1230 TaxID=1853690 RepID=UPI0009A15A6B|nr:Lrp/AsnC family transcriptional regulator [Halolamina sp. CBA1230]QKY20033.1 Lrp/AsnC family transcriptional regulator [Halolamina sp. CBA1230]